MNDPLQYIAEGEEAEAIGWRDKEIARLRAKLAECERERGALKQQAEIWAQEARTQRATVHEIYRLCTGGKGEPGDWHGAEPVRELVAYIERLEAAIREAYKEYHHGKAKATLRDALEGT